MTVKRRLAISNVLMILVPVIITLAISLGCLGVVWLGLTHGKELGLEETGYQLFLFATQGQVSILTAKLILVIVAGVLGLTVLLSILFTNRFLIQFVFRHIQEPLDLLSHGVAEIGAGNLDYRIQYDGEDEFSGICREFNNMAAHLQESVTESIRQEESRKELMAGISHDLRSPLTSILAYVEGLQEGVAKTPEKMAEYLNIIHDKTRQIQALVSQLFLYTKLDLAAYPIHPITLDLTGWLTRLTEGPGKDFAQRGLIVSLSEPLPQVTAWADPSELERVVLNCLDNSAKYKNKPEGQMTLTLTDLDERIRLTLADDGPGVAPRELSKLFSPFYRGDKARQDPTQGSGLGLAIAAKAIGRMGGRIWAAAGDPTGLTICIELAKEDPHHGENSDH